MKKHEFISIGKITKNQGNKGEVRAVLLSDFPQRFEELSTVYIYDGHKRWQEEVEKVRFHKNFIILKFRGNDDIESALRFRGCLLQIPRDQRVPLDQNSFYIDDIKGFEVFIEDGKKLGVLDEVITNAGSDIFIVGDGKDKYQIPAARKFIKDINTEKKMIQVSIIPGLLDL